MTSDDRAPDADPPAARPLFPRDGRLLRFLGAAGDDSWLAAAASTERYVVQAIGDSLAPRVQENDLLVMDLDRPPTIGDIVVLDVTTDGDHELHLKLVLDRTATGVYLTSKRGDLTLPAAGVELLGVIVDQTRRVPNPTMELDNPGPGSAGHLRRVPDPPDSARLPHTGPKEYGAGPLAAETAISRRA